MNKELKNTRLTEDADDERAVALANYLGINPDDVTNSYDHEYSTEDGDYLVLTEDEAYEEAKRQILDIIDDLGFNGTFGDNAQMVRSYVAQRGGVDDDWFEEFFEEDYTSYVDDIEDEGDNTYGNRLIAEMYDNEILTDDDFNTDEDGEVDYSSLKDTVDMDGKKEEYVRFLVDSMGPDYGDQFMFNFGEEEYDRVVEDYNLIDMDAVAEFCIQEDGVAHNIASYDGEEIELDNDFYAYRTN